MSDTWKRTYAAGVVPACKLKGTGETFILLGEQSEKLQTVWSPFWGWQSRKDQSVEETAAREGFEESLGIFGSKADILKALSDKSTRTFFFKNCYLIYLGELDSKQMDYFVFKFSHIRYNPQVNQKLKRDQKEVASVRWISMQNLYEAAITVKPAQDMILPGVPGKIREFFHSWIVGEDAWALNKIKEFALGGLAPIKQCWFWDTNTATSAAK